MEVIGEIRRRHFAAFHDQSLNGLKLRPVMSGGTKIMTVGFDYDISILSHCNGRTRSAVGLASFVSQLIPGDAAIDDVLDAAAGISAAHCFLGRGACRISRRMPLKLFPQERTEDGDLVLNPPKPHPEIIAGAFSTFD